MYLGRGCTTPWPMGGNTSFSGSSSTITVALALTHLVRCQARLQSRTVFKFLGLTSLGLGGVTYGPSGGGVDKTGQLLAQGYRCAAT
jgi:hypothetical protein